MIDLWCHPDFIVDRNMYRPTLTAITAMAMFSPIASGQLVQVGPEGGVRINAPFVQVEVGPLGETYVHAPFTSVYAPGHPVLERPFFERRLLGPMYQVNAHGLQAPRTDHRLAGMNWRDLRQHLQRSALRLDDELDRRADAEVWRNYLRTQQVLQLASRDSDQSPSPDEVLDFQSLFEIFQATTANPELGSITELAGFHTVREGLRQMSRAPHERLRGELATSAMQLDQTLRRSAAAAPLRRYLELPVAVYAGMERTDTFDFASPDNVTELELVLGRYDRVSHSPEHRGVAALESFRTTRRLLSEYLLMQQKRTRAAPEPAPPEILPSPEPALR
jgi:hypothetical protein